MCVCLSRCRDNSFLKRGLYLSLREVGGREETKQIKGKMRNLTCCQRVLNPGWLETPVVDVGGSSDLGIRCSQSRPTILRAGKKKKTPHATLLSKQKQKQGCQVEKEGEKVPKTSKKSQITREPGLLDYFNSFFKFKFVESGSEKANLSSLHPNPTAGFSFLFFFFVEAE